MNTEFLISEILTMWVIRCDAMYFEVYLEKRKVLRIKD